uniref:TIGR02001 family outer membrane protein n=1 Tax=Candidatus Kentrum sp. MB TaxID=2138164 RepID=A0A451BA18_9GAMM|nr:MAG: conserved hypothetical protein [Candidatus Kentron sp. MB]VFK27238.1 MAG: conserved hypothetical protein [Candidatus Kentron sp. MB]VFK75107.1 MAG: conserved hypothetical protein [Candidatus Kentron sp. MB]
MQTTTKLLPFAIGCLSVLSAAHADTTPVHDFSGNVAITSDYIFRGITQTNEGLAIQGGFEYTHTPSGFYAGAWASNVEFNAANNTNDSSIEMDLYAGIRGDFLDNATWDMGGIYYYYPDQNEDAAAGDYNYLEIYGALGYQFPDVALKPTLGAKLSYSNDYFGEDDGSLHSEGSIDLALPQDFGLGFNLGFLDVSGDKTTPRGYDYFHGGATLSKDVAGFGLALSYHRVFDNKDCPATDKGFCKAVVFSVSRDF